MRTTFPLVVVLSMMLMAAFMAGSGFNALVDGSRDQSNLQDKVNSTANQSGVGEGEISGSRRGTDDGSIVGLVIRGGRGIAEFAGLILLLPLTLVDIGFPRWFAFPVGTILELIMSIGIIQFISGRIYR